MLRRLEGVAELGGRKQAGQEAGWAGWSARRAFSDLFALELLTSTRSPAQSLEGFFMASFISYTFPSKCSPSAVCSSEFSLVYTDF